MKFAWLVYIIGLIAIAIAIGFLGSDSDFNLMLLMVLLFVWAFSIPFPLLKMTMKRANNAYEKLPESTVKATIVSKEIVTESENIPNGEVGYYERETTHHKITFRTEAHNQWEFDIDSSALFDALIEDDHGTLVYKETKKNIIHFVSFQRQS